MKHGPLCLWAAALLALGWPSWARGEAVARAPAHPAGGCGHGHGRTSSAGEDGPCNEARFLGRGGDRRAARAEPDAIGGAADQLGRDLEKGLQDMEKGIHDMEKGIQDVEKGVQDIEKGVAEAARTLNETLHMPPPMDYNIETRVPYLPISLEAFWATVWVCLIGSVPLALVVLVGGKMTRAHKVESLGLMAWLGGTLYMFTRQLTFTSMHYEGSRPLTVVEAVYLLTQILTTVGYGDIVPAEALSRVGVAGSVIVALCLYGSLLMEVAGLIQERLAERLRKLAEAEEQDPTVAAEALREKPLKDDWDPSDDPVDMTDLLKSLLLFIILTTTGVFFFYYFPGEGKTLLQCVYMAVITLSTVGFGDVVPSTEGGKIFCAFWMLFGVATLANLVGGFVGYMVQVKARERHSATREKLKFFVNLRKSAHWDETLGDQCLDEYGFFKFGLLLMNVTDLKDILRIEDRFAALGPDENGLVSYEAVRLMEGPPTARLAQHRRQPSKPAPAAPEPDIMAPTASQHDPASAASQSDAERMTAP